MSTTRPIGIAVIIASEDQHQRVQIFLSPEILYIPWHPNMTLRETAVVLKANKNSDFSAGKVGSAEFYRRSGIKVVPFSDNLAQYIV